MEWNRLVPELVVQDYERSKQFYVDAFGFFVADPDGYLFRFCERRRATCTRLRIEPEKS